ncbi:MAG: PilZ domain-containing protein [Hyphomicrobiaceae bacterium]
MKTNVNFQPDERRAHPRTEAYQNAIIRLPQGGSIDCIIHNISEGGAVLLLINPNVIPVRFQLFLPEGQLLAECMVCRFSGSRIAVKFLPSDQDASHSQGT